MRQIFTLLFVFCAFGLMAQDLFEVQIDPAFGAKDLRLVESPVQMQILFIGGESMVQTTETYGNAAGEAPAKQQHDFIGFTPATADEGGLGWISVNHESIVADDMIGDGGGMTVFKVERSGDTLAIMDQTLADGRSGQFFNVDFANTVGETGMNCGGITSQADGRIWTAEEWFRRSNAGSSSIFGGGEGVRDTADFTLNTPEFPAYDGSTIAKYENFNYMVEIDPREAVAIRKQYNWGRQPFEGGVVMPDNKTVYLGPDNTPGFFGRFIADTEGDFTVGTLYAYKHDIDEKWVEIDQSNMDNVLNAQGLAVEAGATMFNRIEWVAYDPVSGDVFFTATGRDNPGSRWADELEAGAVFAPHILERAAAQGVEPTSDDYVDYYGRIIRYDVETMETSVYMEGGPDIAEEAASICDLPTTHLSNPDGLNVMSDGEKSFLIICEDLNGDTYGRTPLGTFSNFSSRIRTCELYAVDLAIENPTYDDLIRIAVVPFQAEVTGAQPTSDNKTLLVNSQHPSSDNPAPYNNALTFAINGMDELLGLNSTSNRDIFEGIELEGLEVFPNPATREIRFSEFIDVALYNVTGQRLRVYRNVNLIDVADITAGTYFLRTLDGRTAKVIVE